MTSLARRLVSFALGAGLLLAACAPASQPAPTSTPPAAQQKSTAASDAAATSAPQQSSATTTLRLGHASATSHPFHDGAVRFAEAVGRASNGAIKVEVYPARQLGDDLALLQQVQIGGVDAAVISAAVFGGSTPVLNALQLPFLIRDYDMAGKLYTSEPARKLLDKLTPLSMRGLAIYEGGFRHFLSTKGAVQSPNDLKGLKVRVAQAPLHLDIWNALGASPAPMAYGEVYTALQTRAIDSVEINTSSIYGEKFYEVAKFYTLTGQYMWPGVLVLNQNRFNTLSADQQRMLIDAAQNTVAPQVAKAKEDDDAQLALIKQQGVQVFTISNLQPFQDVVKDVYEKYEAMDPAIREFVAAARALSR